MQVAITVVLSTFLGNQWLRMAETDSAEQSVFAYANQSQLKMWSEKIVISSRAIPGKTELQCTLRLKKNYLRLSKMHSYLSLVHQMNLLSSVLQAWWSQCLQ